MTASHQLSKRQVWGHDPPMPRAQPSALFGSRPCENVREPRKRRSFFSQVGAFRSSEHFCTKTRGEPNHALSCKRRR